MLTVFTVRQRLEEIGDVKLEHFPELFLIFYYFVFVSTIIFSQYFNIKNIFFMYISYQNLCINLMKFHVILNCNRIVKICKIILFILMACLCSVYFNLTGYENLYIIVFYNFSDLVLAFYNTHMFILLYSIWGLIKDFNDKIIETTDNKKNREIKKILNNLLKIHCDFYELCVIINRNFYPFIILIFMTSWALIYVLFKSVLATSYGYDYFLWCLDNLAWNLSNFFCTCLIIVMCASIKYEV